MKLFLVSLFCIIFLGGCSPTSQEYNDKNAVDRQQQVYASNQPIHAYDWSNAREELIQIYDQKTSAVATYSYFLGLNGNVIFSCPSRGYPIEGGSELTNPVQAYSPYSGSSSGTIPISQADPDGIFHPNSSQGTYVICVRPNGDTVAVYAEPTVLTLPFEAKIVNGQLTDDGISPTKAKINLSRATNVTTPPKTTPTVTR